MWKKVGRVITNNFGLKVLAAIFAIILWLAIANTEDMEKSVTFTVPVQVINSDYLTDQGKTYEILNNTDEISFTVTGPRSVVEQLSADDFRAVANMQNIDESMSMVPISLTATSYSNQLDITSRVTYLMLDVENLITREYEIRVEIDGEPPGDYVVADTEASPDTVTVTGAESLVDEIDSAKVTVDVNGAEESFSSDETVLLLDEMGIVVGEEDLTVDVTEAEVTVTLQVLKQVPVTFHITGEPEEGYWYGEPECDVDSILIQGDADVMDQIDEIMITSPSLNTNGKSEDFTAEVPVADSLPRGVELVEDEPEELIVTVPVEEAVTTEVEIPLDNLTVSGLADGLSLEVTSDPIVAEITGTEQEVKDIDVDDLTGTIDASDMDVGTYVITVDLDTGSICKAETMISVSITMDNISE